MAREILCFPCASDETRRMDGKTEADLVRRCRDITMIVLLTLACLSRRTLVSSLDSFEDAPIVCNDCLRFVRILRTEE